MPKKLNISENEIIEFYLKENSVENTRKYFNVSYETIRKILIRNNYILAPTKKYNYRDDIFRNIDSEEKAYWLGFLFADGYVRMHKGRSAELRLKLSILDNSHVELFSKFMSDDNLPIKYENRENIKSCKVSINSKRIVSDLIRHGCVNKKSLIVEFPNLENVILRRHFIRGYFDGDGCISIIDNDRQKNCANFSICSASSKILNSILDEITKNVNIPIKMVKKRSNCNLHTFVYTKKDDIYEIYKYLYNDATIFLNRKQEKFKLIEKIIKSNKN